MVPDPAKRCSSPLKALSIRDGIPGKINTLRTLTWEQKVGTSATDITCGPDSHAGSGILCMLSVSSTKNNSDGLSCLNKVLRLSKNQANLIRQLTHIDLNSMLCHFFFVSCSTTFFFFF